MNEPRRFRWSTGSREGIGVLWPSGFYSLDKANCHPSIECLNSFGYCITEWLDKPPLTDKQRVEVAVEYFETIVSLDEGLPFSPLLDAKQITREALEKITS